MKVEPVLLERFYRALVEELLQGGAGRLREPFTVAEIYQSLVPYRTHRDRIGVEMNEDYEDALLHLLAGEGDYLELESEKARERIRRELGEVNPNTGLYREFAALEVRLNPEKVPAGADGRKAEAGGAGGAPAAGAGQASGASPSAEPSPSAGSVSRCPDCRETLPPRSDLRFCPHCGTDVTTRACGSCGQELDRSWRFCVACGAKAGG